MRPNNVDVHLIGRHPVLSITVIILFGMYVLASSTIGQLPKQYYCPSCCQYRSVDSFLDKSHGIVASKCFLCRSSDSSESSSLVFTVDRPHISAKHWCFITPEVRKQLRVSKNIVPHAKWIVLKHRTKKGATPVVVAKCLYHQGLYKLFTRSAH